MFRGLFTFGCLVLVASAMYLVMRASSCCQSEGKQPPVYTCRVVTIAGILSPEHLAKTTADIPSDIKNAGLDLLYVRVHEHAQAESAGFVFNSRSKEEKEAIYKYEMLGTKLCLIPTANEVPMFVLLEPLK